jgi:large subunit ribosomal protein L18Ae
MVREYVVIGRRADVAASEPNKIYRMRIFASNAVSARSRFFYFVARLRKVKHANGEILACHEVREHKPTKIKNYGIFLRYNSIHGTHNIYKEFRDVSRCGAVHQLYSDMASQHQASGTNIQVIDVKELAPKQIKRKSTLQFLSAKLRFPLPHRVPNCGDRRFRRTFTHHRPATVF